MIALASNVLAGIAWDPQIRGALAVAVGVLVLMGSVYLLLGTNLGNRLGFMLALTGFFGWMAIMGVIWWMYGIGWTGDEPSWQVEEINTGDLAHASLDDAQQLQGLELPDPEQLNELTPEEFETVSEEHADQLGDWSLLPPSDPSRGEAQATAEEALAAEYPGIEAASDYVVLYGLETGGKTERDSDSAVDRVTNTISNSLTLRHPPHYAIIQVVPSRHQEAVPGEAPPVPEPNPGSDVISVIMVRDLGTQRVPAAATTVVSTAMFGLLCYMLHVRDKTFHANLSAPLPAVPPDGQPPEAGG